MLIICADFKFRIMRWGYFRNVYPTFFLFEVHSLTQYVPFSIQECLMAKSPIGGESELKR